MTPGRRLLVAMLAPGAALGLWLGLGAVAIRATLVPEDRAAVDATLSPLAGSHGMLVVLWWLVAAALAAWGVWRFHARYVAAPARLADAARVLVGDAAAPDVVVPDGGPGRALAEAINGLAGERRAVQREMAERVAEASREVADQRDQLGALMAELDQSVVVCNLDGRILLYNERARQLVRRLSRVPGDAAGAELIGLGRSIDGVVGRALIAHAIETLELRSGRGGMDHPSPRFVTGSPAGHLISVSVAPVRSVKGAALAGLVLLLEDVTDAYEAESRRDRDVIAFIEASRASLAGLGAALDLLDYPELDPADAERFRAVVRDEATAMGTRLAGFAERTSERLMTRWPLQEMLGADLLDAAERRIEADSGLAVRLDEVDPTLWLSVDSFALLQALAFLVGRLVAAFGRPELSLRLDRSGSRARLDLAWSGQGANQELLGDWRSAPMGFSDGAPGASVRDVAERHDGEVWIERGRAGGVAAFRFLLPLASAAPAPATAPTGSRPEYYDFDLLSGSEGSRALDERLLSDIGYTVFDTETTGLDPANGDEIIQIGATRIVNGKLLRGECFDQLVDPQRSIPESSTAIHGIRPQDVRGKPAIAEVLPAFHAFASDTVLVGHNVAFDLRFIKLKEAESGIRFDQPVLDTLLLASVVHPMERSHGIDVTAARLGLAVSGRHTALGDALATAEVFLKLLPLLRHRGILTLSQAREAARASYYTRLRY